MKSLAILGAGGHGKVVAEAAELSEWQDIIFFDDKFPNQTKISKWVIKGNSDSFFLHAEQFDGIHVAIGNNKIRREKLKKHNPKNLVSIIHPSSIISASAKIGIGTSIFAGVVINSDAFIDKGVILNTSCTIEHDCEVHSFAHICPGVKLAGSVSVGSNSMIGIGTSVIQNLSIGCNVVVGAGSVVTSDIPPETLAAGVPAK